MGLHMSCLYLPEDRGDQAIDFRLLNFYEKSISGSRYGGSLEWVEVSRESYVLLKGFRALQRELERNLEREKELKRERCVKSC